MTNAKREKVAKILVEATVAGDKATADKYGISVRSLQRYRAQLPKPKAPTEGEALAESVAAKKATLEAGWADEIPGALKAAVEFLRKAAEAADPCDPAAIHSVAGAMKLLSEVAATWKVLDARLARQAGQNREAGSPVPPGAGEGRQGSADRAGVAPGAPAGQAAH